jgi:hypothetical protein
MKFMEKRFALAEGSAKLGGQLCRHAFVPGAPDEIRMKY